MTGRGIRAGAAALLLTMPLMLGACTEGVKESCRGSNGENSCTASYKTSDGQWSTTLDANLRSSRTGTVSGTFTITSGSGTLIIQGADEYYEYELTPEEPVVVEDVTLQMQERSQEYFLYLEVTAEPQIDGFSAEYTWVES